MMRGFFAVAWNGFREAIRNRVTMVIAAFAIVLLLSTTLVEEVTVSTFDRVITDFGLGTMTLLLVPMAVYLSCGLIPREIERRTVFLIVTRPLSRATFVLARIAGNMITLGVLLAAMVLVFGVELAVTRTPVTQPMVMAVLGLYLELLIITCAGMLFSAMSSQVVSAIITVGLYFSGHLADDLYRNAQRAESTAVATLGRVVYFLVPNLERVNFKLNATYVLTVPSDAMLHAVGVAAGWATLFAIGAATIFERRDFK